MTLANLSDWLSEANAKRSPKPIKKNKPRKVRNVDAFIVRFPGGMLLWTSAKLADRWKDRRSGELIHPWLLEASVAGRT